MSPPKAATSFTTVELRYAYSSEVIRNVVSTSGSRTPVRLCHLQFIFKVCDRAESADDRMRLAFLRKINSEPAERTDFDILECPGSLSLVY